MAEAAAVAILLRFRKVRIPRITIPRAKNEIHSPNQIEEQADARCENQIKRNTANKANAMAK